MNFLGNVVWFVFGGLVCALGYIIGGLALCITVFGIPWGLQCFKIAGFVIWPFGRKVVNDKSNGGCLSLFCNIIWLVCGGFYTALFHIFFGIILFITVIGIPFARQHFKLAELSMMPFGKTIV